MVEIKLDYKIKELPFELQNKIFHYSILHPTAKIMKELIKEIDEKIQELKDFSFKLKKV